jgi:hypothetical protein
MPIRTKQRSVRTLGSDADGLALFPPPGLQGLPGGEKKAMKALPFPYPEQFPASGIRLQNGRLFRLPSRHQFVNIKSFLMPCFWLNRSEPDPKADANQSTGPPTVPPRPAPPAHRHQAGQAAQETRPEASGPRLRGRLWPWPEKASAATTRPQRRPARSLRPPPSRRFGATPLPPGRPRPRRSRQHQSNRNRPARGRPRRKRPPRGRPRRSPSGRHRRADRTRAGPSWWSTRSFWAWI